MYDVKQYGAGEGMMARSQRYKEHDTVPRTQILKKKLIL